jgi:hypothetical protein
MQVVVPAVSLAAVLQGTALTVCVETPSGATLSKPGPVSISGKAVDCKRVPRRALAAGGPGQAVALMSAVCFNDFSKKLSALELGALAKPSFEMLVHQEISASK